jgi:gamma-polyglutamate synthase
LRRIPIRVCVTGTRGKSTVTRLVASALRESGLTVLAKTTGSRAALIMPDGSERILRRRGLPNILEQKRVVRLASKLGAGALVTEMMSIRGECLSAESHRIVRPGVLVLTNARIDHVDLMGRTRPEVAACLASAIPRNGVLILPEEELMPVITKRAAAIRSRVIAARKGGDPCLAPGEFEVNSRLALETARYLGVDADSARRGFARARPDFGNLRAWVISGGSSGPRIEFVNAFAANDPESTRLVLDRVFVGSGPGKGERIGLLNLRDDRGDRTLLWAEALEAGSFDDLDRIALVGRPSRALSFRLKRRKSRWAGNRILLFGETEPEPLLRRILAIASGPAVVIGLGNIAGTGTALVEYFERMGKPCDI